MSAVSMKVGRNEPCPCGSGRKAKHCCAGRAPIADGRDAEFLVSLGARETHEIEQSCKDCQLEVWLEVLDLPDVEQSCRLVVRAPRPRSVLALRDALGSGDPDGVADHLPAALDAVDHPASRASIARAVLELEASGGLRPAVAEAAVGDLSAGKPSVLLMAALLAGLSAEVGVRPTRLAGLAQALGPSRPRSGQPRATRCRRKSAARGTQSTFRRDLEPVDGPEDQPGAVRMLR